MANNNLCVLFALLTVRNYQKCIRIQFYSDFQLLQTGLIIAGKMETSGIVPDVIDVAPNGLIEVFVAARI